MRRNLRVTPAISHEEVEMLYLAERTYREIAAAVGTTIGGVGGTLFKIRRTKPLPYRDRVDRELQQKILVLYGRAVTYPDIAKELSIPLDRVRRIITISRHEGLISYRKEGWNAKSRTLPRR